MTARTLYWYDFETFGNDPRRDRAAQFAGLRTDESLNILGEPLVSYCKPSADFLPSPQACLITGITPRLALEKGVPEAEFIAGIEREFSCPNTCVAGYNNLRFDDELTRQLLYRNFYNPYEREWKHGNSRWDIIDMLRLCAAVRPEGIEWPRTEEGIVTFRLEALTAANGIAHADAHDALADVLATIELARLVRRKQPKLFDYAYRLRDKREIESRLDLQNNAPVLHVSSMYPAAQGRLALIAPLCRHPRHGNEVIVYDLKTDPVAWLDESVDDIRSRIFVSNDALNEGTERIPLRTLHINRCPIVAPVAVLDADRAAQFGIDFEAGLAHLETLRKSPGLKRRLQDIFSGEPPYQESDPDFMIYSGGFFSDEDYRLMSVVRDSSPEQLAKLLLPFKDRRLPEMLFRYRARNFPASLDDEERQRWESFRLERLNAPESLNRFEADLNEATKGCDDPEGRTILASLNEYARAILAGDSRPFQ